MIGYILYPFILYSYLPLEVSFEGLLVIRYLHKEL